MEGKTVTIIQELDMNREFVATIHKVFEDKRDGMDFMRKSESGKFTITTTTLIESSFKDGNKNRLANEVRATKKCSMFTDKDCVCMGLICQQVE